MNKVIGYAVRRTDNGKYYSGYGIKDGAAFVHWEVAPDKPRTLDACNWAVDFCERTILLRCNLEIVNIYES